MYTGRFCNKIGQKTVAQKTVNRFCFWLIFRLIFTIEHDQFFADIRLNQPIKRQEKARQRARLTSFHLWKITYMKNAEVCLLCQRTYNWSWPLRINLKKLY